MGSQYLVFVAFCVPIIGFVLFALTTRTSTSLPNGKEYFDDFLVTSRTAPVTDVGESTVAYMLQISTTFYFVFWGFRYGLANIGLIISWAVGIWLFSLYAKQLLMVQENFETLAHFLSSHRISKVRRAFGLLTALFFLGLIYVETYFAADFLSALFAVEAQASKVTLWWIFFIFLLVSVACYSFIGGMRKVIETDRIQLAIAYISFAVVFAYLVPPAISKNLPTGLLVWLVTVSIYLLIHHRMRAGASSNLVRVSLRLSILIMVASILFAAPWNSNQPLSQPLLIGGPLKQILEPWGWFTLLGFTIANLLWQFGDSSNYQRIKCLAVKSDENQEQRVRALEEMLKRVTYVAPLTWGFGIVLGMLLSAAGIIQPADGEEYASFLTHLAEGVVGGDLQKTAIAIALGMSICVVMLSTVDSSILAFMQVTIQDVQRAKSGGQGLIFLHAMIAIGLILGIALMHKHFDQTHVFAIVGMFNAFVILLAIPALLALRGRAMTQRGLYITMIFGVTLIVLSTFGPIDKWPLNVKMVLPFFAAVVGVGAGLLFAGAPDQSEQAKSIELT